MRGVFSTDPGTAPRADVWVLVDGNLQRRNGQRDIIGIAVICGITGGNTDIRILA